MSFYQHAIIINLMFCLQEEPECSNVLKEFVLNNSASQSTCTTPVSVTSSPIPQTIILSPSSSSTINTDELTETYILTSGYNEVHKTVSQIF